MSNPMPNYIARPMELTTQQRVSFQLEELVDQYSLQAILDLLESICYEKAEHLLSNWQDASSARAWEQAAKPIGRAVVHSAVFNVS